MPGTTDLLPHSWEEATCPWSASCHLEVAPSYQPQSSNSCEDDWPSGRDLNA